MREGEVAFKFRMRENTHKRLKAVAEAECRSINSQIEYFVLKGIEEFESKNSKRNHGAAG